jgi:hypothetical protein
MICPYLYSGDTYRILIVIFHGALESLFRANARRSWLAKFLIVNFLCD